MTPITKDVLVEKTLLAIEGGYIKEAGAHLTEDFQFCGASPDPMNKEQYLQVHQALVSAMPDWAYNIRDVEINGDTVTVRIRITATHVENLEIPALGVPTVKGTGKRIIMPPETMRVTVADNRISRIEVDKVPGGGLSGLLRQVGVELPVPAGV